MINDKNIYREINSIQFWIPIIFLFQKKQTNPTNTHKQTKRKKIKETEKKLKNEVSKKSKRKRKKPLSSKSSKSRIFQGLNLVIVVLELLVVVVVIGFRCLLSS